MPHRERETRALGAGNPGRCTGIPRDAVLEAPRQRLRTTKCGSPLAQRGAPRPLTQVHTKCTPRTPGHPNTLRNPARICTLAALWGPASTPALTSTPQRPRATTHPSTRAPADAGASSTRLQLPGPRLPPARPSRAPAPAPAGAPRGAAPPPSPRASARRPAACPPGSAPPSEPAHRFTPVHTRAPRAPRGRRRAQRHHLPGTGPPRRPLSPG